MSEKPENKFNAQIASRNNWLKIFVVVVVTTIISVKLWQADFNQVFTGFDFSDLLSLFLALFSITLAVLFYFKATDTSNVFYDNTYRFTRDVSEILGRVESGFGERLKHLDEGYSGLKSAVEKIPYDREKAKEEIKEEEEQVEKVENERNQLLEDLAKRARLEEAEKEKLFDRLKEQDEDLSNARKELHFMQRRLSEADNNSAKSQYRIPPSARRMIRDLVLPHIDPEILFGAPTRIVNEHFSNIMENMSKNRINMLRELDIVNSDYDLTDFGKDTLRKMFEHENT